MTEALRKYRNQQCYVKAARRWKKRLSDVGRNNEFAVIHSVGANPNISIQYDTGGQNYWPAKEEVGDEFVKALNDVIASKMGSLAEEAIAIMEKDLNSLKDAAKQEYTKLFDEGYPTRDRVDKV